MNKLTLDENAKEDWLKLVKKHKKKQKGLPALSTLNTDAGDVETHIKMFNKMTSSTESPNNNPVSGPFGGDVSTSTEVSGGLVESLDLFEALEVATPYMLRNDGRVFTCGDYHPYIKPIMSSANRWSIKSLFERNKSKLKWFYNHTQDEDTKLNIIVVINSVIANADYYNVDKEELEQFRSEFDSTDTSEVNIFDLESLYELLNQKTNQEFCRFRTSDVYSGGTEKNIYFRISSHGFNWFDLIWNFVYNNKNWIKSVTITGDPQSGKSSTYYKHNDVVLDHLNIDEFTNLTGRPVFEKLDLQHGVELHKAYELGNPYYWVQENNSNYDEFLAENFTKGTNMNKEKVELYYTDLELDDVPTGKVVRGRFPEPDDYITTNVTTDYSYYVDKSWVIEALGDLAEVQEKYWPEGMSSEEYEEFLVDNFDDLFEEFEEQILDHFREYAEEDARDDFDPDDYFSYEPEYDPYDRFYESKEKVNENLDDNFDMSLRAIL